MQERLAASRPVKEAGASADYSFEDVRAGIGVRILAYLVDSAVLFAFTMIFASISFLNIFLSTDSGNNNPTDAQIWTSLAVLMLTIPAWFLFSLAMTLKRSQTIGQYIFGLAIVEDSGDRPGLGRLFIYWLGLHPLLFHPLLAGFWLLFAYAGIAISESEVVFIGAVGLAFLCLVAPLVGLLFLVTDPQRRGLHDRLAGLRVVRSQV
jgi:uncharacterized RDD family membrane protein YckC